MVNQDKKIFKFENLEQYKKWLISQDWYQTIHLKDGLIASGKLNTDSRIKWFDEFNFSGKTVLDIGCNSGQYSFNAKKNGAQSVTGLDVNEKRIYQAKMLALNEGLDVEFHVAGVEQVADFGMFDIVICIAVVTEVENVLGALRAIKNFIHHFKRWVNHPSYMFMMMHFSYSTKPTDFRISFPPLLV